MKNAIIFVLLAVIVLLALGRDRAPPEALIQDTSLIRKADFPLCVLIKPPPLLRGPNGKADFRLGQPFNDRGDT